MGYSLMGFQRVRHDLVTSTFFFTDTWKALKESPKDGEVSSTDNYRKIFPPLGIRKKGRKQYH